MVFFRVSALALIVLMASVGPSARAAEVPSLSIDTVNVRQQGTITFSELMLGTNAPAPGADLVSAETEDQRFLVAVDLNSVQPGRFGTFAFNIYLQQTDLPHKTFQEFIVTGNPTGVFLDVDDRIAVHVKIADRDSQAYINVPLHSGGQVDLIATEALTKPTDIKLGQQEDAELTIRNKLENLPLVITKIEVKRGCNNCWKEKDGVFQELKIADNGATAVSLGVKPNTLPALAESALVVGQDQPHDTLRITITYHAGYGGQERSQQFVIPVRFSPSIWALLAAVLIGSALGFIANIVFDATTRASWRLTFGKGLVLAVIVEIVALTMASLGTKVVVFTFDLDPQQFLPTVVIALLVSGGATVIDILKKVFAK